MSRPCPNCGYDTSSSHKFCHKCRFNLSNAYVPDRGLRQKFFSVSGRLNPVRFWLRVSLLGAANSFFVLAVNHLPLAQGTAQILLTALQVVLIISATTLIIRRSHDLGHAGYFFFVLMIVLVVGATKIPQANLLGLIVLLYLNFFPGDKDRNKFGVNPAKAPRFTLPAEKNLLTAAISKIEEHNHSTVLAVVVVVMISFAASPKDNFFREKYSNSAFDDVAALADSALKKFSAPKKSEPLPKPQTITLTKPLTSDNQKAAVETLVSFHREITQKNYRAAYNRLSYDFQSEMTYDGWIPGFDTTISSSVDKIGVVSESAAEIVLSYVLTAVDNINGREKIFRFRGTAKIIDEGGVWKIDDIRNDEI